MPYIYLITNDVNQKQYIGKTTHKTIQERWKEHIADYRRSRCEKRPLYNAMNKYGIEHFSIQEVEFVPWGQNLEEREQYWINYYDTYHNGYNATLGGEGTISIDRQLVIDTYKRLKTCKAVAKELNIGADTVSNILKSQGIEIISGQEWNKINTNKPVNMIDNNGNILKTFNTLKEAALYIQKEKNITTDCKGITSHIRAVCNNKRKTAYSHKWKWKKE